MFFAISRIFVPFLSLCLRVLPMVSPDLGNCNFCPAGSGGFATTAYLLSPPPYLPCTLLHFCLGSFLFLVSTSSHRASSGACSSRGQLVYFSKVRRVPPLAGKQHRLYSRACNDPSRSFHRAWRRPILGPTHRAFNKEEALVGAYFGHCKTSRRFIDRSIMQSVNRAFSS